MISEVPEEEGKWSRNSAGIDSEFFDILNEKVPEKFAFLSVGQWTKHGYGEDRKDLGRTAKVFFETFANSNRLIFVGGGKAKPITSAPRYCNISASQDPLNPVCPVIKTFLFFQK